MNSDIFVADAARPAGFWIRVVAAAVDFGFFFLVQFSLGFVAGRVWGPEIATAAAFQAMVVLFTIGCTALYTTLLHAATGQTLGKLLVGVRVIDNDGALLSIGSALLRYLGYFVSAIPVGLGFFMAGLRRDKRALHDLLAGSRVEHRVVRRRQTPRVLGPDEVMPPVA